MSREVRRFHEQWIGEARPEGLVVSVQALEDAQCYARHPLSTTDRLRELALLHSRPADRSSDGEQMPDTLYVPPEEMLFDPRLLGFDRSDFDGLDGRDLPKGLRYRAPEGRQIVVPSLALRAANPGEPPEAAGAAKKAGARYDLLVWRLPRGLEFDRPETATGGWEYRPSDKFIRLLSSVGVSIGLLSNDETYRLIYAPRGQAPGWVDFRVREMAYPSGRTLLDAFLMLLSAESFLHRPPEARLPAILKESRARQGEVTEALAGQVFRALTTLLEGFEEATARDWVFRDAFQKALAQGDEVYGGLLTVLLRMVFVLFAEDRSLLPLDHALYAENYSLLGLFDDLQRDAGEFPDSMDRRFGAWDRVMALFWAIYDGVDAKGFSIPARRGGLFDPDRYPFLEGRTTTLGVNTDRAKMSLPQIDDGTMYEVLRQLIMLDGQRLSYRTLGVEEIGSVYEGVMGYHVVRLSSTAVFLKLESRKPGIWVESRQVLDCEANRRAAWLQNEVGFPRAKARKVAEALEGADSQDMVVERLQEMAPRSAQVKAAGRLVLQPGTERRRTSSHYTPSFFSGAIVDRTLQPLLKTLGDTPSAEQLLELKICDPAMGSGAFLVEACRRLGKEVEEAWDRDGRLDEIAAEHGDVETHAKRLVAQRCLYGVDKNLYAVDLAKLSLWLETLSGELPFTFLDHALRYGDSLVGLGFDQIRGFHWDPDGQQDLTMEKLSEALDEIIQIRQDILDLAGRGAEYEPEKRRLLRDAEDAGKHARLIGDLVVGAFFAHTKKAAREKERRKRLDMVNEWLESGGGEPPEQLNALRDQIRKRVPMFHWMLEFPEIFYSNRPDPLDEGTINKAAFVDCFIGNPPFAGKNQIAESGGPGYLDWLKSTYKGSHGNADLSAYFLLRSDDLLGKHGTIGLIATNTIAQGDTRSTGLQTLVNRGLVIYAATESMPWPGAAAVVVSVVHLAKGKPAKRIPEPTLGRYSVPEINSRLRPKPERSDPERLESNLRLAFQGSTVLGMGFILAPDECEEILAKNPECSELIFPYLGGQEVNNSPTQSHHRYVINFGQMPLAKARQWPELLQIVEKRVKPERLQKKRDGYRKYWWRFAEYRPGLYSAIRGLNRCYVNSQVSKHLIFCEQPVHRVFGHTLYCYALEHYCFLSVMQSRLQSAWAGLLSSSMKSDPRYSVSDCFETFPFPIADPRAVIEPLEEIGRRLSLVRREYTEDLQTGLTQLYNQLKDPRVVDTRIIELRQLHEEMDRAVLEAYGWSDIEVPPYTDPVTEEEKRARQAFEDEVIDRLFVLNAGRAKEERRKAAKVAAADKKADARAEAPKKRVKADHPGQHELFRQARGDK